MKKICLVLAGIVGALVSQQAQAITLNFSSLTDADVVFQNGGFSFVNNGSGDSFNITTSSGVGDAVGDDGNISGSYSIGTVHMAGPSQSATVTGSGILTISDGGLDLTGNLIWGSIGTFGTGGTVNVTGTLNVTSIAYSGTQSDLLALAAAGAASDVITFQLGTGQTLNTLKATTSPITSSFSGTITAPNVPDGGTTVLLLGVGLSAIGLLRKKMLA